MVSYVTRTWTKGCALRVHLWHPSDWKLDRVEASTGALNEITLFFKLYLKIHVQFALANEVFKLVLIKGYYFFLHFFQYLYVEICVWLTFLHPKNTPCSNARQSQSHIGVILLVTRYGTMQELYGAALSRVPTFRGCRVATPTRSSNRRTGFQSRGGIDSATQQPRGRHDRKWPPRETPMARMTRRVSFVRRGCGGGHQGYCQ